MWIKSSYCAETNCVEVWRKSSYSTSGACVEVWHKSSYSAEANCVEVRRKSSYSSSGNCVEVWHKSGYSADTANCVEVGCTCGDVVRVRDSKDSEGPVLTFSRGAWAEFVGRIKDGTLSTD